MASACIVIEDDATAESVVASLEELPSGVAHAIMWDLSRLTAVPWLELPRLVVLLHRKRERLSTRIERSTILLPSPRWKRVLTIFFGMYTPSGPVSVALADNSSAQ